jgi:hypothetical protein
MQKIIIYTCILAALLLGFGYWYSVTHGSVNFRLQSQAQPNGNLFPSAEIILMDKNGKVLARGINGKHKIYSNIHLIHPEIGSCMMDKQSSLTIDGKISWQTCFKKHSTWVMRWIKDVKLVQVKHTNCITKKMPIMISKYNTEWMLWWVPLPHVGGMPYSYYDADIMLNEDSCI